MIDSVTPTRRTVLTVLAATGAAVGMPGASWGRTPHDVTALPFAVADKLPGAAIMVPASKVRIEGWLGARIAINAAARLSSVDLEPLLAGFRKKPGSHPWIGEHIGKWMHAATLAWANTGDSKLKTRLDYAARSLVAAQEPDGYLGTYLPKDRMILTDNGGWDVWAHKYCLIGLLTYYRYTGDKAALGASRKAADLLIRTFPAKRSILQAGYHAGMAATSVLEPIVLLHRVTGDPRYLDFAAYIVKSWQETGGPDIVRTLLARKGVEKVGNAKAYEMLSNIVGICELARVTGDSSLVDASVDAWENIVGTQLFVSGATSDGEFFQPDDHMREEHMPRVGETCVTTTWIQLNQALFQLTGEARYGNELERTYYNALTAAQHPEGHNWCYFTPLNGKKKYDEEITCCHSSGPRGIALSPSSSYLTSREGGADMILVSTLETSTARLDLGGRAVQIEQLSGFPSSGVSRLRLSLKKPARFGIKIRVPRWAAPMAVEGATMKDGWAVIGPRRWSNGDEVALSYTLGSALTIGTGLADGRQIVNWGPFILAAEDDANAHLPPLDMIHYAGPATMVQADRFLRFEAPVSEGQPPHRHANNQALEPARLVTYADAGAAGSWYRIWLRRKA
jgi:DUF1680 family protein